LPLDLPHQLHALDYATEHHCAGKAALKNAQAHFLHSHSKRKIDHSPCLPSKCGVSAVVMKNCDPSGILKKLHLEETDFARTKKCN
jgi:hypothetical protein